MKKVEKYLHLVGKEVEIICRDYSSAKTTLTEKHLKTWINSNGNDIIILQETKNEIQQL